MTLAQIVPVIIFIITFILILTERIHRTIVAMVSAAGMLAAGMLMGFYTQAVALEAIDFYTVGLLLGMMILVSVLEPTGIFEYLAIKAGQISRGDPWRLLILLSGGTTLVSLFMNNVTTVVLIGPVTILICELLGLSPVPYLMAEALLSDTAGIGTSIGDPASVLIASASRYTFIDFLAHSMPIVAVAALASLALLRFLFRRELTACPADPTGVLKLDANEALHDRRTARRVLEVMAVAVGLFFLQGTLNLTPAYIALAAAAVALVWIQPDMREVLARVDWNVLIFFSSLFIVVGGLEATGVFETIAGLLAGLGGHHPMLLGIAIIWFVASLSALVDNIPVTIAMIPVLKGLSAAGVDVSTLWWALAFGAGFGGNATPIGSTANIVIVSLSERTRTPITPILWSRRGLPVMITTCIVGSVLFALTFPWLGR
jgi:Na+/H+ antiporter NhaD/arsenite permease-like protein